MAEDIENLPISVPEINYPPSLESSQNSEWSPVEQTTEREEENKKENRKKFTVMKRKFLKRPQKKIHRTHKPKKNPDNSQDSPLQEEPIHTRGEKYNLRPNPYPNYSGSYRY